MKTCSRCNEVKTVSEFPKRTISPDGLGYICKACVKIKNATYRENNREALKERDAAYYQKNKEQHLESGRRWAKNNPEANRAIKKRYSDNNPDKVRRNVSNRRARIANAPVIGYWPNAQELVEFYGTTCMIPECEGPNPTADHIVPLSVGGNHHLTNAQPLCKSHNSGKCHRDTRDYRTGVKWIDRINGHDVIYKPY